MKKKTHTMCSTTSLGDVASANVQLNLVLLPFVMKCQKSDTYAAGTTAGAGAATTAGAETTGPGPATTVCAL